LAVSQVPEGYELVHDQSRIDPVAAHAYLTRSYWSPGVAIETVTRAMLNSLCVAIFHKGAQVAMARLVTDYATMAYLADVYVLEEHRGHGLSHAMLDWFQAHPDLQGLRRWLLFTADAHELYASHGWTAHPHPERLMVRVRQDLFA
jgi:GNAT superfamily N-acetyltransferase